MLESSLGRRIGRVVGDDVGEMDHSEVGEAVGGSVGEGGSDAGLWFGEKVGVVVSVRKDGTMLG